LAIVHAQFEIIHPFFDGNGRLGRMLIPLILYEKKMLDKPCFYISEYLEKNRDEYCYRLNRITSNGDWEEWIKFFLDAIIQQAKSNKQKTLAIMQLYEDMKRKNTTKSLYFTNALDAIFKMPIFNTTDFIEISQIPHRSAIRFLNKLINNKTLKIIREGGGRNRPRVMVFVELFDLVNI
jgi:Fic family protein